MRNQHVVGATIVYCVLALAIGLVGTVITPSAVSADGIGNPDPPNGASTDDSTYSAVTDETAVRERVVKESLTLVDVAKLAILTIF